MKIGIASGVAVGGRVGIGLTVAVAVAGTGLWLGTGSDGVGTTDDCGEQAAKIKAIVANDNLMRLH